MPEVTTEKRFIRMVKFLVASTERAVARELGRRGFTDDDRQEGWSLMDRATGRHLAVVPGPGASPTRYHGLLVKVDGWENEWYDVAEAALKRRFPALHAEVFKNLSKGSGSEVVITVRTLLDRLDGLAAKGGDESRRAMALLETRGLTPERRDKARALLRSLEVAETGDAGAEAAWDEEAEAALRAEKEAAVQAMWAWYQEWAKTARTVVRNRNHLIMLGLARRRSRGSAGDDADDAGADDAPTTDGDA